MHGLKVKYMMHIKVETEEYYFVLPSKWPLILTRVLHIPWATILNSDRLLCSSPAWHVHWNLNIWCNDTSRNWGILICITLWVPIKFDQSVAYPSGLDCSVAYTSGWYFDYPPVDMQLASLICIPKSEYLMYILKSRNSGILICIAFQVSRKFDHSVVYTMNHYPEQPPVDVQLTSLMCGLIFKYVMYIRVGTEACQFL